MARLDQSSLDVTPRRGVGPPPHSGAVTVRALTLADCAAYRQFAGRLDRDDLRLRFAGAVNFSAEELCSRFLDIDHEVEQAFAAVDVLGNILGVGRLHRLSANEADIAIIVRSDSKRRGLGRLLLAWLQDQAAHAGIRYLHADILRENYAMLELARRFGFRSIGSGGIMAEVRLDLASAVPAKAVSPEAANLTVSPGLSSAPSGCDCGVSV